MGLPIPEWFDPTQIRRGDGMLSYDGLRPSEVVHLTVPDPAEQAPLVARSVTPPPPPTSPSEMIWRGGTTLLDLPSGVPQQRAPRSCTVCCHDPPPMNTPVSEGGRDDRGVPYHAESTLSSAQVLTPRANGRPAAAPRRMQTGLDQGGRSTWSTWSTWSCRNWQNINIGRPNSGLISPSLLRVNSRGSRVAERLRLSRQAKLDLG